MIETMTERLERFYRLMSMAIAHTPYFKTKPISKGNRRYAQVTRWAWKMSRAQKTKTR